MEAEARAVRAHSPALAEEELIRLVEDRHRDFLARTE
jgi:hypothetical protein